jgi:hypothetical protein
MTRTRTKMYVVMSNDYPAAIFSNQRKAARFCDDKNATQRGVRWSVYVFKVNDTTSADVFHARYIRNENND